MFVNIVVTRITLTAEIEMDFQFIGHCYDQKENHDKVWGVICMDDRHSYPRRMLTFWGRRGKKLQTKMTEDNWDLTKLIRAKENKGYDSVNENRLNEVYPEFQADLEKTAMWAMLKL